MADRCGQVRTSLVPCMIGQVPGNKYGFLHVWSGSWDPYLGGGHLADRCGHVGTSLVPGDYGWCTDGSVGYFEPLEVSRAKHATSERYLRVIVGPVCSSIIIFAWYCVTVHFTVSVTLLVKKFPISPFSSLFCDKKLFCMIPISQTNNTNEKICII